MKKVFEVWVAYLVGRGVFAEVSDAGVHVISAPMGLAKEGSAFRLVVLFSAVQVMLTASGTSGMRYLTHDARYSASHVDRGH